MKDKSVLDSFSSLRKSTPKFQIKSGVYILKHFFVKQKRSNTEEPCEEFQLGIERVIRGLGAPRFDSRKGFFLTFIGLCDVFSSPTFTIEMCFKAIDKELAEFTSKAEENDVYKGQVLAYGGLIYSNKILEANHKEIQKVLRQLILISSKKSYLSVAVHTFLVEYLKKIDEKVFKKSVWPILLHDIILSNKEKKSLQWYHLLSVISKTFSNYVDENFLLNLTQYPSVYDKGNLNSIGNLLLVVSRNKSTIDSPIYQDILQNIAIKKKNLKIFWQMVDNKLSSTTPGMISHVFKLFICCCQRLGNKNFIKYFLTPNFVAIIESGSDTDNVEEIRQHALEQLVKIISEKEVLESDTHLEIVQKLFFYPGNIDFLRGYGLKIFQAVSNNFTEDTVKSVSKYFMDVLCDHSTLIIGEQNDTTPISKQWKDNKKKIACNIIVKLLNHPKVIKCVDWKVEQMKIIINVAFFSSQISPTAVQAAKYCFFSCLDIKFIRLTDLCTFLNAIVNCLNEKVFRDSSFSFEISEKVKKYWQKMITVIKKIETETCDTDHEKLINTMFRILFLALGVMIFKEPDSVIDSLKELLKVYKHKCHDLKNFTNREIIDDNQEPYWTDVLVELILSLLSNDSRFFRNVITRVFITLCPHLSSQNIHQILNVLNPNIDDVMSTTEVAQGNDKSINKETSGSESEMDVENSESEMDVDSSEIDESEIEEEIDDKDIDKLRATMREALGDTATMTDNESVDLDDLDEEQGKRLDQSLSEAFKQMKQQKLKSRSAEKVALSHFRARVIDLLETWVKTEPSLNDIFEVMVTVLMLLEKSLQTDADLQLQTRLKTLLKKLTSVKQFSTDEKINVSELGQLLKKIIDKDEKSTAVYVSMSQQIVDCSRFILKISMRDLKRAKKLRPIVLEAYKQALNDFFSKTNPIVPAGLFYSALELSWEGSFDIIKDVCDYTFTQFVRPFQLKHGLNFLQEFLKNNKLFTVDLCSKYCDELRHVGSKLLNNTVAFKDKQYAQYVKICKRIEKLNTVHNFINEDDIKKLTSLSVHNKKRKLKDDQSVSTTLNKSKKLKSSSDCDVKMDEPVQDMGDENIKAKKSYTKREKAKHKTALQVKKRRKYARSKGMSQGLEEGVFGNSLLTNLNISEIGDNENEYDL